MDQESEKPQQSQPSQQNKPEQTQQQPPEGSKPEKAKIQPSPPTGTQEAPKTQQPSLIKKKEEKKRKIQISAPPKSFIIAVITIGVTIAAGVAIAIYLGKMTKKEPKIQDKGTTPTVAPIPTRPLAMPTIQESLPSPQETTPSSSFEELLQPQKTQEAAPSESQTATKEATPTQ